MGVVAENVKKCCECPGRPATFPTGNPVHCCHLCYERVEQGAEPAHTPACDRRYAQASIP